MVSPAALRDVQLCRVVWLKREWIKYIVYLIRVNITCVLGLFVRLGCVVYWLQEGLINLCRIWILSAQS